MQILSVGIGIIKKIFIKKISEYQKLMNKGLHFLAAVLHLLNFQIFLIHSKRLMSFLQMKTFSILLAFILHYKNLQLQFKLK